MAAQLRAGDSRAFEKLYEQTADAIFAFCLRRTRDWALAQDCTSMVFLEAWRLRNRVEAEDSLRAWLFGIANNVVRNSVRARRRHQVMLEGLPVVPPDPGFETELAARLDASRDLKSATGSLRRLSRADREVLAMAAWSDLSTEEIAQALGISAGTVKSRLSRARARARRALDVDAAPDVRPALMASGLELNDGRI